MMCFPIKASAEESDDFPDLMPPHGGEPLSERGLCLFITKLCVHYPVLSGKMLDESERAYKELDVGGSEKACLLRAFFNWRLCGSVPWEPVTMTYKPSGASRSFPSAEAVEAAYQRATRPLIGSGDEISVSGIWEHERQKTAPLLHGEQYADDENGSGNKKHGMGELKLAFVWVKGHTLESFRTSRKFFGELAADVWVMNIFNSKQSGFYIDLAANDAVQYSNTLALERLGWDGLCIEAQSKYLLGLLHRKCKVVQAIVSRGEEVVFNPVGHCGSNCGHVIKDQSNPRSNADMLPSVTFGQIIRDFRVPAVIDFLSLDIEGSEDNAMSTFPWETHKIL
jgi:hypothetical protein